MLLISSSIFSIAAGLLCFYDSELAWRLYEKDSEFLGRTVRRSGNWQQQVIIAGIGLIALGMIGFLVGLRTIGF